LFRLIIVGAKNMLSSSGCANTKAILRSASSALSGWWLIAFIAWTRAASKRGSKSTGQMLGSPVRKGEATGVSTSIRNCILCRLKQFGSTV
jgi:hypothetical protein